MRSSPPRCFSTAATTGTSVDKLQSPPPSHLIPEIDQHSSFSSSPSFPAKEAHPMSPTALETQDSSGVEEAHPSSSSSSAASETLDSHGSYCMRLVKIYCEGDPLLHVTIRNKSLILAPANHLDSNQWWLKDEKHAGIKDEEGFPCFALVSKATGQAIGCSNPGYEIPLELIEYNPTAVGRDVPWTEGRDLGSGYRTVRPVSNIKLCMNAYRGATMGTRI